MTTYIIRRLLWLIPVLLTVSAVTFVVMRSAPGGPWDTDAERRQVDAATAKSLAAYYGLDKPMWRQFYAYVIGDTNSQTKEWVCGVICGNLGPSYRQRGRTVQNILFSPPEGKSFWQSRFGYSVRLGVLALSMAIFVGIPLGIIAALKQNTIVDYTALFIATSGISVPSFVLAIFLIIIFASRLHWIDIVVDDWTQIKYWLMPMAVLGFGTLAYTARLTRSSMLEVMRQDYVRTARAKGLSERVVIMRHAFRNALIPFITIVVFTLPGLFGGAIITESIFAWPGMGLLYIKALGDFDYPVAMSIFFILAVLTVIATLLRDVLYTLVDPRIRLS